MMSTSMKILLRNIQTISNPLDNQWWFPLKMGFQSVEPRRSLKLWDHGGAQRTWRGTFHSQIRWAYPPSSLLESELVWLAWFCSFWSLSLGLKLRKGVKNLPYQSMIWKLIRNPKPWWIQNPMWNQRLHREMHRPCRILVFPNPFPNMTLWSVMQVQMVPQQNVSKEVLRYEEESANPMNNVKLAWNKLCSSLQKIVDKPNVSDVNWKGKNLLGPEHIFRTHWHYGKTGSLTEEYIQNWWRL